MVIIKLILAGIDVIFILGLKFEVVNHLKRDSVMMLIRIIRVWNSRKGVVYRVQSSICNPRHVERSRKQLTEMISVSVLSNAQSIALASWMVWIEKTPAITYTQSIHIDLKQKKPLSMSLLECSPSDKIILRFKKLMLFIIFYEVVNKGILWNISHKNS